MPLMQSGEITTVLAKTKALSSTERQKCIENRQIVIPTEAVLAIDPIPKRSLRLLQSRFR
ncbi:MAG: hypothetical protein VR78_16330 [Hoeflea sp. BRH_c9]|nr:MAG: hypothetical protein VR78_16330 [Hoeflea sp. BRH_c9]